MNKVVSITRYVTFYYSCLIFVSYIMYNMKNCFMKVLYYRYYFAVFLDPLKNTFTLQRCRRLSCSCCLFWDCADVSSMIKHSCSHQSRAPLCVIQRTSGLSRFLCYEGGSLLTRTNHQRNLCCELTCHTKGSVPH